MEKKRRGEGGGAYLLLQSTKESNPIWHSNVILILACDSSVSEGLSDVPLDEGDALPHSILLHAWPLSV